MNWQKLADCESLGAALAVLGVHDPFTAKCLESSLSATFVSLSDFQTALSVDPVEAMSRLLLHHVCVKLANPCGAALCPSVNRESTLGSCVSSAPRSPSFLPRLHTDTGPSTYFNSGPILFRSKTQDSKVCSAALGPALSSLPSCRLPTPGTRPPFCSPSFRPFKLSSLRLPRGPPLDPTRSEPTCVVFHADPDA